MQMNKTVVFVLLGLAVGVVAGSFMSAPEDDKAVAAENRRAVETESRMVQRETVAESSFGLETRLCELQRRLDQEVRARKQLEGELRETRQQLAQLEDRLQVAHVVENESEGESGAANSERAWFDEQALLDSGMEATLAGELRLFYEQLELERLMLRDRSARENWERGRLREEMQLLEDREETLRERLGDEGYDAYLYASGQTNRVEVSSVLESAQAGQAGIRSGDYIMRYDNERVYNWRDLRSATTSGDISDTIEIEVERDGETLRFYLARGPLGIRMNSLRIAP